MKKLISLIIIVTMIMLTLTSCDELVSKFLGDQNANDNDLSGGINDPIDNTVYTITEENWQALNAITNYTLNAYITSTIVQGDESAVITGKSVYKSSENAIYDKTTQTSHSNENVGIYLTSYEMYYTIHEGSRYYLAQDQDGKWTATQNGWKLDSIAEYFSLNEAIEFDDLTYDADLKAYTYTYTYTYTDNKTTYTMHFYFKNGVPTRIYGKAVNHYDNGETESEIFDAEISSIGVTHVIIPQLVLDEVTYN